LQHQNACARNLRSDEEVDVDDASGHLLDVRHQLGVFARGLNDNTLRPWSTHLT